MDIFFLIVLLIPPRPSQCGLRSSVLPYDILCRICDCVDFETLKVFSLVCHETYYDASKRLWRSSTIGTELGLPVREAQATFIKRVDIIMANGHALRLRHLRILVRSPLTYGDTDPRLLPLLSGGLVTVLRAAVNLMSLDVRSSYHEIAIARYLSAAPPLSTFTTDLSCGDGLADFWRTQKQIESLDLLFGENCTGSLNSPLPLLKTVRLATSGQTRVVRGSPVTTVIIRKYNECHAHAVVDDLAHSTATITRIELHFDLSCFPTSSMYTDVIASLPYLRFIKVWHPIMGITVNREKAFNVLSRMQHLEEFEWVGFITMAEEEELFSPWANECRSLRKATFRWHNRPLNVHRACIFERESTDAPWKLVHRE